MQKLHPAAHFAILLLASAVLLTAGCAARPGSGETAISAEGESFADLPALVLNVNEEGALSTPDSPGNLLGPAINGPLANVTLPQDIVEGAASAEIEQIFIDNTPSGLILLVNNQPLLTPVWNDATLESTSAALANAGLAPTFAQFLPLLNNLGAGAVLQFPAAETEYAVADLSVSLEDLTVPERPGSPVPIDVVYSEDGTYTANGQSAEQITFPPGPWTSLNLPPDLIQGASDSGIETMQITTSGDGIFLRLNGEDLPFLDWSDERLTNTLQTASDLGLLGEQSDALTQVQALLPLIQQLQLDVTVSFP